ncbi:hypothetical protein M9979_12080 [Sphingomonas sp. RP10(2022)]|uniref:Uncharacterized protein n=1 Tax=Sphingomonas liriopis TaxID=2949094 RepID=A0A9X2KRH5_9SPHN|nr:hypothetical protein [Sphingomonas liriopis]MCP3735611.1 hypothetical protein [Sphingomonas liriopis]
MFARLARAFRPLDTTAVDAAIADANAQHRAVTVRARALRMSISCDGAADAIGGMATRVADGAGYLLRQVHAAPTMEPVPPAMLRLLDRL